MTIRGATFAAVLALVAGCASENGDVGEWPGPEFPDLPTDYVSAILDDIAFKRGGIVRVRALGVSRPAIGTYQIPGTPQSRIGYRVCVAYAPKYRFGGFLKRRTYIYWFAGNAIRHITADDSGLCGTVREGWPQGAPDEAPAPPLGI